MAQHREVMDLISDFKAAIAEMQQLFDDEIF